MNLVRLILSSPPADADPLRMKLLTKTRPLTKTRFRIRSVSKDEADEPRLMVRDGVRPIVATGLNNDRNGARLLTMRADRPKPIEGRRIFVPSAERSGILVRPPTPGRRRTLAGPWRAFQPSSTLRR